MGVEPTSPLTRVGHADADLGAGRDGHQCRAEESLQVDRQVVTAASQFSQDARHPEDTQTIDPFALSVEDDQIIEIRMAQEHLAERRIHDPGQVRRGPRAAERRQDRQGMDDVAERARLDDADASGFDVCQATGRPCHGRGTPFPSAGEGP